MAKRLFVGLRSAAYPRARRAEKWIASSPGTDQAGCVRRPASRAEYVRDAQLWPRRVGYAGVGADRAGIDLNNIARLATDVRRTPDNVPITSSFTARKRYVEVPAPRFCMGSRPLTEES